MNASAIASPTPATAKAAVSPAAADEVEVNLLAMVQSYGRCVDMIREGLAGKGFAAADLDGFAHAAARANFEKNMVKRGLSAEQAATVGESIQQAFFETAGSSKTTISSTDHWQSRARRVITGTDGGAGGKLTGHQLATDVKVGIGVSIPMELVMESQAYRKGEMSASKYTATVMANSLGFGTWTLGGAAAAALLAPVGLSAWPLAVAGFAAGMIANTLWDRTFGQAIIKVVSERLPENVAKPFADKVTKYFANPIYDHVWLPLKNAVMGHKVLTGVLLAGLALRFPMAAKGIGREATVWIAGSLASMGVTWALIDRILPDRSAKGAGASADQAAAALEASFRKALTDAKAKGLAGEAARSAAGKAVQESLVKTGLKPEQAASVAENLNAMVALEDAYTTAFGKFKESGASAAQADTAAQKWLVGMLCKNGADLADAQKMVKTAAENIRKAAPAARKAA